LGDLSLGDLLVGELSLGELPLSLIFVFTVLEETFNSNTYAGTVARFFMAQHTKAGILYHMTTKFTKGE
jgi:hypothetical protein